MTGHKAPCGHPGEPIIGTFVRCLRGCDGAVPQYVRPEVTEKICHHESRYQMDGKVWCVTCGKKIV